MFCNKCGKEILEGTVCAECENDALKVDVNLIEQINAENLAEPIDSEHIENINNDVREVVVEKIVLVETPKERKKRLKKEKKAEKKRLKKEKRARNKKKRLIVWGIFIAIVLLCAIFYKSIASGIGTILLNNNEYSYAYTAFSIAENAEMLNETKYQRASNYMNRDWLLTDAYNIFKGLEDYKDSSDKAEKTRVKILEQVYVFIEENNFSQAERYLNAIKGTKGVDEATKEMKYQNAAWLEADHQYVEAKKMYKEIKGYKDVNEILAKPLFAVAGHHYSGAKYLYDRYYVGVYYFGDFCSSLIQLGYSKTDSGDWHYLMEDGKVYFSEHYVAGQERTITTYKYMFTIEEIKRDEDGEATKIKINGIWHDMAT